MMNAPGRWEILDDGLRIISMSDKVQDEEIKVATATTPDNATLIAAAANGAMEVNPTNPLAVALAVPRLVKTVTELLFLVENYVADDREDDFDVEMKRAREILREVRG